MKSSLKNSITWGQMYAYYIWKWCNDHSGRGKKIYIYTVYTLVKCQTLALQTGLMSLNSVSNIGMTPAPPEREREGCSTVTYTLAWGFFFEKSQARPRSEIRTWPCSSNRILAGWGAERGREREREGDTDDGEYERYDHKYRKQC